MTEPGVPDERSLDRDYRPFPPFSAWVDIPFDTSLWDRHVAAIEDLRTRPSAELERAFRIVRRVAAIETGAIEGLYEVELGFTLTVAMEAAAFHAALEAKPERVRAIFQSQLEAYEFVLDFATGAVPIGAAWIRELHSRVCSAQETYRVRTPIGEQDQPLPKGEYKRRSNHVELPTGGYHAYAPVDRTPDEMHRLVTELSSPAFASAHPVIQAAYAHYCLAAIHPFSDGNGRVARALGSVYTYRAAHVPLLIAADGKRDYLAALRAADQGRYDSAVAATLNAAVDAIRLVHASLETARHDEINETLGRLRTLAHASSGFTHQQIDQASALVLEMLQKELHQRLGDLGRREPQLPAEVIISPGRASLLIANHRVPHGESARIVRVRLWSAPPAQAVVEVTIHAEVPGPSLKAAYDIVVISEKGLRLVEVDGREIIPEATAGLRMRIAVVAEQIARSALSKLNVDAIQALERWMRGS